MTASISKLLHSWLFITALTSKFNNFLNRSSTMLNNVFKRGRACTTGNGGTLCVNLQRTTCVWLFSADRWPNPVHVIFFSFFNILFFFICKSRQFCNRLHVSTNRGPSSLAMMSMVCWWSVRICPRLTVLTHTHTHTRITNWSPKFNPHCSKCENKNKSDITIVELFYMVDLLFTYSHGWLRTNTF